MTKTFVPKDSQELPDSYGVTIYYVNGKTDKLELASHAIKDLTKAYDPDGPFGPEGQKFRLIAAPVPMFECVTSENIWNWIPISSVTRFEFDKSFSKVVSINQEMKKSA